MGKISDRVMSSVDDFAGRFGDRLRTWGGELVTKGTEKIVDRFEPEGIEASRELLEKIRDNPDTPPLIRNQIDNMLTPKHWIGLVAAIVIIPLMLIPMVFSVFRPLGNLLNYVEEKVLHSGRLDTGTVITAWRRDKAKYEQYFSDLEDQGFSLERIEALKFATLFYPAPADLIRWQAREVFEPEMIERYGLDDEFGAIEKEPFYKAGMTDEQILNFWRAHWEHASWMQVVEMLHRGLMTEEQVWDWFRVVEIPPFWRQKLIDTAYSWPTRVDVRRWWDMRTIDETELRRLYSGMGYHGVNLDNYILWTKVYTDFPSLMARWTKGWITEDDVRRELVALGMPAERVETMIQEKIKPEEAARVEEGKTLTKTEIYKGVKQGFITRAEGTELIMDLGYNRAEAEYLMDINVAALEGSPETFAEFKDLTTKYKMATGMEVKPMPEEIKKAAAEVVKLTGEVEALERSIAEEKRGLIEGEPIPEATTKRLKSLQVKRNRAISTLEKAKSDYNQLLSEWRHGLP